MAFQFMRLVFFLIYRCPRVVTRITNEWVNFPRVEVEMSYGMKGLPLNLEFNLKYWTVQSKVKKNFGGHGRRTSSFYKSKVEI